MDALDSSSLAGTTVSQYQLVSDRCRDNSTKTCCLIQLGDESACQFHLAKIQNGLVQRCQLGIRTPDLCTHSTICNIQCECFNVTTPVIGVKSGFKHFGARLQNSFTESHRCGATGTRITQKTYDNFDRLEQVTDAFGEIIRYGYDANGNRTRLTDPDGQVTQYQYDALNRVASVVNNSGVSNYAYDRSSLKTRVDYAKC